METLYRIYVKHKSEKRFAPMDLKNGHPVINLIYASLLTKEAAEEQAEYMREQNSDFEVQIRKA